VEATGVLLMGGLSRRFGSVKALAPLGAETLAERAWRILGEAFLERIRTRHGPNIPVVVVTSKNLDSTANMALQQAGVTAVLRKGSETAAIAASLLAKTLDLVLVAS